MSIIVTSLRPHSFNPSTMHAPVCSPTTSDPRHLQWSTMNSSWPNTWARSIPLNLTQISLLTYLFHQSITVWGLFSRIFFSVPASSALVERIFSHSGLILKPHRARMFDSILEALVYLKCNWFGLHFNGLMSQDPV